MPKVKQLKKRLENVTTTLLAIDLLRLQLLGKKAITSDQLNAKLDRSDKFSQET
jgi:hypothetical protein